MYTKAQYKNVLQCAYSVINIYMPGYSKGFIAFMLDKLKLLVYYCSHAYFTGKIWNRNRI